MAILSGLWTTPFLELLQTSLAGHTNSYIGSGQFLNIVLKPINIYTLPRILIWSQRLISKIVNDFNTVCKRTGPGTRRSENLWR